MRAEPKQPARRSLRWKGRDAPASRAAILRAAERIFAEQGLAGARTEAIAQAAGVNKALLYYYFRSKNALFMAVIEEHLKEFERRAQEVLGAAGGVRSKLLAYVNMHFDFISARRFFPALLQRTMLMGGPGLYRLRRRWALPVMRRLVGLIEQGVRDGELRPVDGGHTLVSLVSLTVHYFAAAPIIRAVGGFNPYDKKRLAERKREVLDFVRFGLFRHPEERVE
jgi:TetR/AcrR family transcriptional regulator